MESVSLRVAPVGAPPAALLVTTQPCVAQSCRVDRLPPCRVGLALNRAWLPCPSSSGLRPRARRPISSAPSGKEGLGADGLVGSVGVLPSAKAVLALSWATSWLISVNSSALGRRRSPACRVAAMKSPLSVLCSRPRAWLYSCSKTESKSILPAASLPALACQMLGLLVGRKSSVLSSGVTSMYQPWRACQKFCV